MCVCVCVCACLALPLCLCVWVRPDQVYHVAVMMCYDKKLEASRADFFDDVYRTRDVDCVITTGTHPVGGPARWALVPLMDWERR
jgi:hypothetical protein